MHNQTNWNRCEPGSHFATFDETWLCRQGAPRWISLWHPRASCEYPNFWKSGYAMKPETPRTCAGKRRDLRDRLLSCVRPPLRPGWTNMAWLHAPGSPWGTPGGRTQVEALSRGAEKLGPTPGRGSPEIWPGSGARIWTRISAAGTAEPKMGVKWCRRQRVSSKSEPCGNGSGRVFGRRPRPFCPTPLASAELQKSWPPRDTRGLDRADLDRSWANIYAKFGTSSTGVGPKFPRAA